MSQIHMLREQSFLVYGLGSSGASVIKFFKRNKIKNFKVWDDEKINSFVKYKAKNLDKTLEIVDFIVLSPGVSLIKNRCLRKFEKKIITDIDLFFITNNESKSIVVTGTNGKSTTCKLLAHLLKKNKFKTFLGGNIGTPILDIQNSKNDYVIIEASSFQLSHSKFISPDYAFFLNFTNDHLDWHGNITNYLNSKLKIFQLQTKKNYAIIDKKYKKFFIQKKFLSNLIHPNKKRYFKTKLKINNEYLISKINDENMNFVYTFSRLMRISEKSFIRSMKTFKGLPHRFEIFIKKKYLTFINDSKATTFEASQSALSSCTNIYWILGGFPKKGNKIKLSGIKKNIIKCYIIGNYTNFFKKQVQGKVSFSITKNLKNSIIKILKDVKLTNKVRSSILLSPSAASYDQFNNFEKRGEEFKRLCKKYEGKFFKT